MEPTVNQVHQDAVLTSFSVRYMLDQSFFVADRAFPIVPVQKQSDLYYEYDRTYWLRDDFKQRAPGGDYPMAGYGVSTGSYRCDQFALAKPIADEERDNADSPINLDQDAAEYLAQKALIRRERAFAADFMVTGIWTTDNTTATDWDASGGVPITNVQVAARTLQASTGMLPTKIAMGLIVWQALQTNAQIVDLIKYTQSALPADLGEALIAKAFGLKEILVGRASYESAEEGVTSSILPILDDDALLLAIPERVGLNTPTAGATFVWAGGGGGGMGTLTRVRDDMHDRDVAKMKMNFDQKKVAAPLGYFLSDIV